MTSHPQRADEPAKTTISKVESPPVDALGFELPPPASLSGSKFVVYVGVAAGVLLVAFVAAYLPRRAAASALADGAVALENAVPRVEIVSPAVGASTKAMVLPGSVQPLQETVIYARASGYVRTWNVDLGDKVKAGQTLAEIDTPELDQELAQAEAQLKQSQAQLTQSKASQHLAAANLSRAKTLEPTGIMTRAELDQDTAQNEVGEANVTVAEANVAAQQANIRRLNQLKAFAHVQAPFAGTITQRMAEIGNLVTAGNGQPLFKLAATDPARVFVQVPQDVAPSVRADVPAKVNVREYPDRVFQGVVTRAAGELDPSTRTMNTEVRVPNSDGSLIPGMYAEVSLTLPMPHRVLSVPATALVTDANGSRVAVVTAEGKVHLAPVVVERDDGPTIELASGVAQSDRVVRLGSVSLVEGMSVDVMGAAHASR